MENKPSISEIIDKYRVAYQKFRPVYSPVLIPLIKPVIRKSKEITETRVRIEMIKNRETKVTYKALEARVGKSSTRVKVIVKKVGDKGNYYFQSIMKYN